MDIFKLYQSCTLCPRNCGVDRTKGDLGYCSSSSNLKVSRAALHFWEEPPISGSRGSGTVFFAGCNLKCIFCQNYKISTNLCGEYITSSNLSDIFLKLQDSGAHNINLVTPTHFIPHIIDALDKAKANGLSIPIIYNCGGYEKVETLRYLHGYIDIYLPDLKYVSTYNSKIYSSVDDYFEIASSAIKEMIKQVGPPIFDKNGIMKKGVIVRHLMIPTLLSDTLSVIGYYSKHFKNNAYFSLMNQYTPIKTIDSHPELAKTISKDDYQTSVDYLTFNKIENGFVQSGQAASSIFIPDFNGQKIVI